MKRNSDSDCIYTLPHPSCSSSLAAESGEQVPVELISGGGGVTASTTFAVSTGSSGKWLSLSLAGDTIAPGFFVLMILNTESLSAKGCKQGSVNLQGGFLSNPEVLVETHRPGLSMTVGWVSKVLVVVRFPLSRHRALTFRFAEGETM